MEKFSPRRWYQNLTTGQRDILLASVILLIAATLYYFQWAYYLTGLDGSKVNIDQPERYFWWANDSGTYRDAGEWLFGRADNTLISRRPWLYPLLLGLARTLFHGNAEAVMWFLQFLTWLGCGFFLFFSLRNAIGSMPVALIGAGIFYSHPSPLILTFHGMTESLNFLLIAIFCWMLTRESSNRLPYSLLLIVLATVVKPIYLLHIFLLIGYIFLRERQTPRLKQAGLIALVLIPIWIQLILSYIAIGKLTVSSIGSFTFRDYLVADVYMRIEGTEWRETTDLISDWTTSDQLNYLWQHKRVAALTYRAHVIEANMWTGSFFTLREGNRTKDFAIVFNSIATYLHVIMFPLVAYYLLSKNYSKNKETIAILYITFWVQVFTSGISTGQEDRLLITTLPIWILTYLLVLTGMWIGKTNETVMRPNSI